MINIFASFQWKNGEEIPSDIFPKGDGRYSDSLSFLYSIFVLSGVILVVVASIISLRLRKIPLKDFVNGIYISIPVAVIGASFFGKLGSTDEDWKIYRLFFFWEPGLSFFGGMLFGSTAAFIWFWHKKRVTKISIWTYADCIVPNILLGQSVGRWGNLFNHEIMGKKILDYNMGKITWLPDFIWHRLFYFRNPQTGEELNYLQFREPLFLYESFATLIFWIILVFIIPNIWKLVNKKPYKIDPYAFPCKKNKEVRWISIDKLREYQTQSPILYLKNSKGELSLKSNWMWRKAFTLYEADYISSQKLQKVILDKKENQLKALNTYKKLKSNFKNKIKIMKEKKEYTKDKYTKELSILKSNQDFIYSKKNKSSFKEFIKRDSKELYKINNPNNYFIFHAGTYSSIYVIFISVLRIILDSFRDPYELSVKMIPVLNYLSLIGILVLGIVMFISAQFIAPKKWRESGWLYEKSY
ncbi:prolipoprotein diacylglyceryl transferase [Spiroplasma corruscae]|uniref:Prolipoprotein diacylglyceryl transferase n=1 Tax=Spiroplasma corruscae TaxID=216934 RepID=A0A222EMT8_9MOLU|nr:prolipoprotein diacylglyceryl transferase family protein [Spiroplasma corruscae]ASP27836.1 prolipoprotein diacylglyceryl transferase [Spiroplasma corruscae]